MHPRAHWRPSAWVLSPAASRCMRPSRSTRSKHALRAAKERPSWLLSEALGKMEVCGPSGEAAQCVWAGSCFPAALFFPFTRRSLAFSNPVQIFEAQLLCCRSVAFCCNVYHDCSRNCRQGDGVVSQRRRDMGHGGDRCGSVESKFKTPRKMRSRGGELAEVEEMGCFGADELRTGMPADDLSSASHSSLSISSTFFGLSMESL